MLDAISSLEDARRQAGYLESVIADDDKYDNEKFTNRCSFTSMCACKLSAGCLTGSACAHKGACGSRASASMCQSSNSRHAACMHELGYSQLSYMQQVPCNPTCSAGHSSSRGMLYSMVIKAE